MKKESRADDESRMKMTSPFDISSGKKALAWVLAVIVGVVVTYAGLTLWMVVGVFTRVIGMCSGAPHWWDVTYMWLTLLVVVPGFYAGRGSFRWFVERERSKRRWKDFDEKLGQLEHPSD